VTEHVVTCGAKKAAYLSCGVAVINDQGVVLEGGMWDVIRMCFADGTAVALFFLHALNVTDSKTVSLSSFSARTTRLTFCTMDTTLLTELIFAEGLGLTADAADLLSQC
jgi:hypothetical protein